MGQLRITRPAKSTLTRNRDSGHFDPPEAISSFFAAPFGVDESFLALNIPLDSVPKIFMQCWIRVGPALKSTDAFPHRSKQQNCPGEV